MVFREQGAGSREQGAGSREEKRGKRKEIKNNLYLIATINRLSFIVKEYLLWFEYLEDYLVYHQVSVEALQGNLLRYQLSVLK